MFRTTQKHVLILRTLLPFIRNSLKFLDDIGKGVLSLLLEWESLATESNSPHNMKMCNLKVSERFLLGWRRAAVVRFNLQVVQRKHAIIQIFRNKNQGVVSCFGWVQSLFRLDVLFRLLAWKRVFDDRRLAHTIPGLECWTLE